ncbi:MAG: PKD domain-containing protein, partial [Bacteroidia bacterium]
YNLLYNFYHSVNFKFNYNIVKFNSSNGENFSVYFADSAYEFTNNIVISYVPNANLMIDWNGGVASASNHAKICNNKVTTANTASGVAIYVSNGNYRDVYNNDWFGGITLSGNHNRYYNNTFTFLNPSTAVVSYSGTVGNEFVNNLFVNTAGGYLLNIPAASISTTYMDYNNYYTSGSNAIYVSSTASYNIASWKSLATNIAAKRDRNSLTYLPGFTSYSGIPNTSINLNDTSCWSLKGRGMPVSWITSDINGNPRSDSISKGPVCIGAYEFTPNTGVLPPLASAVPSIPSPGSTQTFLFGGDTLASIAWAPTISTPGNIGLRAYPGTLAPTLAVVNPSWQFLDAYWNFTSPLGTYNYNLNLFYKDIWLYNVGSKSMLVGVAKYPSSSWSSNVFSNTVNDSINDILSILNLANLTNALYTGTTSYIPWTTIYNNTISGAQNICPGSVPNSLTGATPAGGNGSYQYTWFSSTTNANSGFVPASGTNNGLNYSPSAVTTNTWFKRLVNSSGITDTSTTIAILVNRNVGFSANNYGKCLSGNNFIFSDTSIGMGTLRRWWNFGAGINDTSTSSVSGKTYSASGTFNVKLVVTDNNGCKDSLIKIVSVGLKPNPGFTINNNSQCVNSNSFVFNDTSTVSSGTLTRIWNFGNGINDTSTSSVSGKTYLSSGTFNVKLVSNSYGCKDSTTKSVTVFPKPNVALTINNPGQCISGNNFLFTDTSSISSGTIQRLWNFGTGINDTSTSSVSGKTYLTSGTYIVKLLETSNNGCKDSLIKTVSISAKPNVGFTINNASQCLNGNNFIFNDTSNVSNGTLTRVWNLGTGVNDFSTFINPNKTYSSSGIYSVKLISNNNGCKDSLTKTVTVNPKPNVGFTINPAGAGQCLNGNNFLFNDTSTITNGSIQRAWNFGTGINDTSTSSVPGRTYSVSGTYNVKLLETSDNGCKDSITKNVTVYPKPNVGFIINNYSQCLTGNNFTFSDTSKISTGTLSRKWNFGNGDTSTSPVSGKTYLTSGAYNVKLVSTSNFGCKDSLIKTVSVYGKPTVGFTVNNLSQCLNGNNFIFNDTSSITFGALTRVWNFGNGTNDTSTSSVSGKVYLSSGNYSVKLIASNNGCKDSLTKTVTVNPKPNVGFSQNNFAQCLTGNNFILNDTSTISSGTINRTWNFGDGATSTSSIAIKAYLTSGIYIVNLVITSNNNCKDSVSKTFTVLAQPKAGFTMNNPIQCFVLNSFTFTDTTSGTNTRLWNFGDGDTSTSSVPGKTYSAIGIFNVSLKIIDFNNCTDSVTKMVAVIQNPSKPVITALTNSLLESSPAIHYQWYLNNSPITGATSPTLTLTQNGAYQVRIDNTNGCTNISDPFTATKVGVEEVSYSDEIKVYPNPFSNELNLLLQSSNEYITRIFIFDVSGKLILESNTVLQKGISYSVPGTSNLRSGFYFMKIESQNSSRVVKIVKE